MAFILTAPSAFCLGVLLVPMLARRG